VKTGDIADSFFIIKSGKVSVSKHGIEGKVLGIGESFGESGLLVGIQIRVLTCQAAEDCICLIVGKTLLTNILGDEVTNVLYRNMSKFAI